MPKFILSISVIFVFAYPLVSRAHVDVTRRGFLAGLASLAAPRLPMALAGPLAPVAEAVLKPNPLTADLLQVFATSRQPLALFRRMAEYNLAHRLTGNAWNLGHPALTDEVIEAEFRTMVGHLADLELEAAQELQLPVATVHRELLVMLDDTGLGGFGWADLSQGTAVQDLILNFVTGRLSAGSTAYGPGARFMGNVMGAQIRELRPEKIVVAAVRAAVEKFASPRELRPFEPQPTSAGARTGSLPRTMEPQVEPRMEPKVDPRMEPQAERPLRESSSEDFGNPEPSSMAAEEDPTPAQIPEISQHGESFTSDSEVHLTFIVDVEADELSSCQQALKGTESSH